MSIVIKMTGRKDNEEPTGREKPLPKWKLTFGRERYPTLPIVVRKSAGSVEKTNTENGNSNPKALPWFKSQRFRGANQMRRPSSFPGRAGP